MTPMTKMDIYNQNISSMSEEMGGKKLSFRRYPI